MYFFDLTDYYTFHNPTGWEQNGLGSVGVGCAGGPIPTDFGDYFTTAQATADAFLKASHQWFMASRNGGGESGWTTPLMDDGCSPSYNDLWDYNNTCIVNFQVAFEELRETIILHDYYYNWYYSTKNTNPFWDKTYAEYIDWHVNVQGDAMTGSTSGTVSISLPDNTPFNVPVTFNYGTSFTKADLQARVTKYEIAIKALMCSLKNMMSVMDGDTFDEYVYDENGNYNINKIGII